MRAGRPRSQATRTSIQFIRKKPSIRGTLGCKLVPMTFLRTLTTWLLLSVSVCGMQHGGAPLDLRAFAAADVPGGIAPGAIVPNFRLTDHRGITRELYYESTTK